MELKETGRWAELLRGETEKSYWAPLCENVERAYETAVVYPPREDLFAAFRLTPPERVRVVILGQDPYHEPGQAHGLSFSVGQGVKLPKSLQNIYKELSVDLGVEPPEGGDLTPWAEQGVFLLNSVLTVEAHRAGSHRSFGWERFTDGVIAATNALPQPIAFLLWGNYAGKKAALIHGAGPRLVLTSAHPSPLSAYRGFFGSRPFSKINEFLTEQGEKPIRWTASQEPAEIQTERLVLMPLRPEDWQDLLEIFRDFETSPYADCDYPLPVEETEARTLVETWAGTGCFFAVRRPGEPEVLGYVCFHEDEAYDLGAAFKHRWQGRGYARESAAALMAHLRAERGAVRFTAGLALDNLPSRRLVEGLGFTQTGTERRSFRGGPERLCGNYILE